MLWEIKNKVEWMRVRKQGVWSISGSDVKGRGGEK